MGRCWSPFPMTLSQTPVYTARPRNVSCGVSVYSPAFAGTKLYYLVTEAHRCEKLAQSVYAVVPGRDSNPRLLVASPTLYHNATTPPKEWRYRLLSLSFTLVTAVPTTFLIDELLAINFTWQLAKLTAFTWRIPKHLLRQCFLVVTLRHSEWTN